MRSHGFLTVEDSKGRGWRHARAHRWWSWGAMPDDPSTPRVSVHTGVEWAHYWGVPHHLVRLKVSTTGEETLDVAYSLAGYVGHYWSFDVDRYDKKPRTKVRLLPVRFDVALDLTGVRWCFGSDDHSWDRDASWVERLRRNDLKWWRVHRWRTNVETITTFHDTVPFPEGAYPAEFTLQRETWSLVVGPYYTTRRSRRRLRVVLPFGRWTRYSTEVKFPNGVPVPGNDESDFYDGQDHIYGSGCAITRWMAADAEEGSREWVEEAKAAMITVVNRHRTRYGRGVMDTGERPWA